MFKLYINELDNNITENYWFCLEGNYNTMELYYYKYNIEINKSNYDILSDFCYKMVFEVLDYKTLNNQLENYKNSTMTTR